jgi:hypothetical protein
MAARIVSLARVQPAPPPVPLGLPDQVPARHQVWRGASGRAYTHSVYSLIECPPLPKASYVLVRREADGTAVPLYVDLGQEEAPTLNLARVRQRGAQLGANEVHVHFAASTDAARVLAVCDLRAGQLGDLGTAPDSPAAPAGH